MNRWVDLCIYVIYRLIRFLIHTLQRELIWRFNGLQAHLENLSSHSSDVEEDCQILTIITRFKFVTLDVASPWDFIWWHDKVVSAKDTLVLDPCWSLYTLDNEYAYFVHLPKPWSWYHSRNAPFVFISQFQDATKLARMSLRAFRRFSEESLPNPKGPVVCLSCCARSGSTLVMKVMQVSEKRIFSSHESGGFTGLSIAYRRGLLDENTTTDLLKAVFKYHCKDQEPGQVYLVKTATSGPILVKMIKKCLPQVKHLFLYRRDVRLMLRSMEKLLRKAGAFSVSTVVGKYCPWIVPKLFASACYYDEMTRRFGSNDCLDQASMGYISAWYYYHRYKHLIDLPIIYYEDLLAEKEKTLQLIFQLCGLPYEEFIGNALQEFSRDSQAGTPPAQENMKSVGYSLLDEGRIKRIHDICDELGVPRLEI